MLYPPDGVLFGVIVIVAVGAVLSIVNVALTWLATFPALSTASMRTFTSFELTSVGTDQLYEPLLARPEAISVQVGLGSDAFVV